MRGSLDEPVLRLGRAKTLGGVWTRRSGSVRITSTSGETVHAAIEPPAENVELVSGRAIFDLSCQDLALAEPQTEIDSPPAKQQAYVRPNTTLEISETEKGPVTVRVKNDNGIAVDVIEKHAGRAHVTFGGDYWGRITGWMPAKLLGLVPKLSDAQVKRLMSELDDKQMAMLGAYSGSSQPAEPKPASALNGPSELVHASCDLRLLATIDGKPMVIGSIAGGTEIRRAEPEAGLAPVSLAGIDVEGGAKVPVVDERGCEAAH